MGNKETSYFVIKSAPDSMKTSQNLLSHYPYGHSPIHHIGKFKNKKSPAEAHCLACLAICLLSSSVIFATIKTAN